MPCTKSHRARTSTAAFALLLTLPFAGGCSSDARDAAPPPHTEDPTDGGPSNTEPDGSGSFEHIDDGFLAVWGAASDDVWAAGVNGALAHYDGTNWTLAERPTDHNILSMCGLSGSDIWAAGDDVILHYDGTAWTVVLADMFEQLPGIACQGVDDIWLVGIATDVGTAVLRRWDGTAWNFTLPGGVRSFWDVWVSKSGVVWTGGSAIDGTGILAKGQDGDFSVVSEYSGDSLRAIWGSGDDDMWVSPYAGPFEHWDGTSFVHEFGASPQTILGMGGTATDDAWAVGLGGTILHFDGESWGESQPHVTELNLTSVWSASHDDVWASGSKGLLLHYDGSNWTHVEIQSPE
jgi:hypothetical protein